MSLPATKETIGILTAERIALLKKAAYLINVGRGSAIDQDALVRALKSGDLAGAALDVMMPEPLPADHPLWDCPNTIITPHIAWATDGARGNIVKITLANIDAWRRGEPQNVVNKAFLK
jgi:phosphoglycerate dehydrogenase-like enzyme